MVLYEKALQMVDLCECLSLSVRMHDNGMRKNDSCNG